MPHRVLPLNPDVADLALLDIAATRALEATAAAALPPYTLMARAGAATARLALAIAPHARRIWIAAGPGNNGGDGVEAAVHLHQAGKSVMVSLFGDAGALPVDAAQALVRARAAGVAIILASASDSTGDTPNDSASRNMAIPPALAPDDLAIDALLGLGARRAPQGALAAAVRALNALACPVLSVDLPSGLNADTGQPLGADTVVATHTLTMLALKPGLFTGAGRDFAGEIWCDTLGVAESSDEPPARLAGRRPMAARRHAQHKGSFGDVAIVGGGPGMTGAALLASRAAHAAGAGRVFVDLLGAPDFGVDIHTPELMLRHGWSRTSAPPVLEASTVVCGCGGGEVVRAALPRLLSHTRRLVLDADALNAIARDSSLAALLHARAARGFATVLTPHPLEAARLLGCSAAEVQADRLYAARELAARCAAIVVLKGSGSVIAAPGFTSRVNNTGNAALASAGTGDVLAGWLGGRWSAQGQNHDDDQRPADTVATLRSAFDAAIQAVAEHGAAAEPPPPGALRASALIERLAGLASAR